MCRTAPVPVFPDRRLRFTEVMTEGTKHQNEVSFFLTNAQFGSLIHYHQRVGPDTSLRMPSGILRYIDQGF